MKVYVNWKTKEVLSEKEYRKEKEFRMDDEFFDWDAFGSWLDNHFYASYLIDYMRSGLDGLEQLKESWVIDCLKDLYDEVTVKDN
jgi:hypothetical protein